MIGVQLALCCVSQYRWFSFLFWSRFLSSLVSAEASGGNGEWDGLVQLLWILRWLIQSSTGSSRSETDGVQLAANHSHHSAVIHATQVQCINALALIQPRGGWDRNRGGFSSDEWPSPGFLLPRPRQWEQPGLYRNWQSVCPIRGALWNLGRPELLLPRHLSASCGVCACGGERWRVRGLVSPGWTDWSTDRHWSSGRGTQGRPKSTTPVRPGDETWRGRSSGEFRNKFNTFVYKQWRI